jgi:type II secretory pathway pseudopilin PulG
VTVDDMSKRSGFSLAELAFALVALSGVAYVLTTQLSFTQARTQDRLVEQGVVQVAGDAARQASYSEGRFERASFEDALLLPTAPDIFAELLDGSVATPGDGVGPAVRLTQLSLLISDDGSVAFLAARTHTGRCVQGSVTLTGQVLVSRPQEMAICLPSADFVVDDTLSSLLPVWRESFAPQAAPGPGSATVGWSASDLEPLPAGAPPVTLYVAWAQRASGGALRSCSLFADVTQNTQVNGVAVEYSCVITDLSPGDLHRVWVVAYSDAGASAPSKQATVTPGQVVIGDLDGEATTGVVIVEWGS